MAEEFYAHTPPKGGGDWHKLIPHSTGVADQAYAFCGDTLIADLAYWAGLLHDLGKFRKEFQNYLRACHLGQKPQKSPHAIWGATFYYWLFWTQQQHPERWKDLSLIIAGHHAGLSDPGALSTQMETLVTDEIETLRILASHVATMPKGAFSLPDLKEEFASETAREMAIRFAFSAVVDADYLNTEVHFSHRRSVIRQGWPGVAELWKRVSDHENAEHEQQLAKGPLSAINGVRREIYELAVQAATGPQGVYRLTAPTGGGKTRAGLAFALRHCVEHHLNRVVIAIPYTSIIDQNIAVYRERLGEEAILEHHSQVVVNDGEEEDPDKKRLQLATENWAAPVVVTTTVQLFESLFANHPSRVRKLHHLIGSVIVLDEVQTLPPELLVPTLDALRELVARYKVTLVLSTATQPALDEIASFREMGGAEIIPEADYRRHFEVLQRSRPITYRYLPDALQSGELVAVLKQQQQVMVILNRRKDALKVLDAFGDGESVFHLSSLLCVAHRREILATIRERLREGKAVHLICTQVVEAGVDISFPAVWRAIGPFDRIIQAAGRCNRNGDFPLGEVTIFELAGGDFPPGFYKNATDITRDLLTERGAECVTDPQQCRAYFSALFKLLRESLDKKQIQPMREALRYRDVAAAYHIIDGDTIPVVVPYGKSMALLESWQREPNRQAWRALQPYIVSLFKHEVRRHGGSYLAPIGDNSDLHYCTHTSGYDKLIGLGHLFNDPSDAIYVV